MVNNDDPYDQLAKIIGDVCIWWSAIEGIIHDLNLHQAVCIDKAFDHSKAWDVLHITLSQMDLRLKIKSALALAHNIETPLSPKYYDRVEKLLNHVDNVARPERNRYIHDYWSYEDGTVRRSKLGAVVRRPQARERTLDLWTDKSFPNIEATRSFATSLELIYSDLVTLDNHLAWLCVQQVTPGSHAQPLPEEWQSLAHHG